jgi:hypothetical protein
MCDHRPMSGVDERLWHRVREIGADDVERHAPPTGLWDRISGALRREDDTAADAVEYVIDRHDVVVAVGGGWDRAARLGEARELVALGTRPCLWDTMGDPELKDLWRTVVSRVRSSGQPLEVEFRCDAPDERRWFQMTVTPLADDGVHFRSTPTFVMERPAVVALGRHTDRDLDLDRFVVCSWCAEGADAEHDTTDAAAWLPIEELLARHRLLELQPAPPVSYGICPRCVEQMSALSAAVD